MSKKTKAKLLKELFSQRRYRGKHVVVIAGRIFTAKSGKEAAKIFKEMVKKYPQEKPLITYIPKEDALILIWPR